MKLLDLDSPNIVGESTKSRSVCNPTDKALSPMRPINNTVHYRACAERQHCPIKISPGLYIGSVRTGTCMVEANVWPTYVVLEKDGLPRTVEAEI